MASSLIPAWIADAPDFDQRRAKQLLDTYRQVRHLLVGAWYPLAPYARDGKHWMASQYHRPDLGEGLVLVVPPLAAAERSFTLRLHGLEAKSDISGRVPGGWSATGAVRRDPAGRLAVVPPAGRRR